MSFILDALRKSETERQRQAAPGLVDAGLRPPARRRGIWLPVLIIVLIANMVLMGALWLRRDATPPAVPLADASAPAPAPPAVPVNAAPAPVGGSLAAAAGVSTPADSEIDVMGDTAAEGREPFTEVLPAPAADSQPETPAPPAGEHVIDALPTAEQLMASGAIPPLSLHLDLHAYSETPSKRFVWINTRRYGEGDVLAEGPRIEAITRDGVVLSEAGQRFVLSRE